MDAHDAKKDMVDLFQEAAEARHLPMEIRVQAAEAYLKWKRTAVPEDHRSIRLNVWDALMEAAGGEFDRELSYNDASFYLDSKGWGFMMIAPAEPDEGMSSWVLRHMDFIDIDEDDLVMDVFHKGTWDRGHRWAVIGRSVWREYSNG